MKKFFIIILFLIGFILIGIEGGNLFSQMGIDIPFLNYKEEKQLPKFIGIIFCMLSIFLFRLSKKRKLKEEQQKINFEKEKHEKWYNSLSDEEKIEIQYKNWINDNPGDKGLYKELDLFQRDTENFLYLNSTEEERKINNYKYRELSPLELRIVHGSKEEQAKRDKENKEKLERDKIKKLERKNELLKKYDLQSVEKIIKKELWLGMTEEMLYEVRNRPLDISESVSKGVVKKKQYYDKSTNRLGNDAFDFEVTLENGKVTGWKDRRNRGTRDI
jgi:hypothetical protein